MHVAFISADPTMSGVRTDTEWSVQDGIHVIRVDDQRYMLPNNLVFWKLKVCMLATPTEKDVARSP